MHVSGFARLAAPWYLFRQQRVRDQVYQMALSGEREKSVGRTGEREQREVAKEGKACARGGRLVN